MTTQELLIDGIERLEPILTNMPESEFKNDLLSKIIGWQNELNAINTSSTAPTCPTGYYWNGSACVKDVG